MSTHTEMATGNGTRSAGDKSGSEDLAWLLSRFVRRTEGVQSAFAIDGTGTTLGPPAGAVGASDLRGHGELIARLALASLELAAALGQRSLEQSIMEMDEVFVMLGPLAAGGALLIVTDKTCDLGRISYEMALLSADTADTLAYASGVGRS